MGTGYIRADTSNNIADGGVINAADLDGEFDALVAAFNASSGHTHDGTGAEGAPILVIGPAQEYVGAAGNFSPKTDDTYDLGKVGTEWKDLHLDGVANIDDLQVTSGTATALTITTLTTELDTIVSTADLPITSGGTGGGTISAARTNLQIEAITQVEAEAGTKTTGAMNPLRTAQAIAALSIDPVYEEFLTSGTWTKPAGVLFVYVEVIGAGMSGDVSIASGGSITIARNGGGIFASKVILATDLAATVTATVGAGGSSVSRTDTSYGTTVGNDGGSSSFGSVAAEGGAEAMLYATSAFGGAETSSIYGGAAGGGANGAAIAAFTSLLGGDGGASAYTVNADATGSAGQVPGGAGGAAGGVFTNTGFTATSGAGAAGRIRVWAW